MRSVVWDLTGAAYLPYVPIRLVAQDASHLTWEITATGLKFRVPRERFGNAKTAKAREHIARQFASELASAYDKQEAWAQELILTTSDYA